MGGGWGILEDLRPTRGDGGGPRGDGGIGGNGESGGADAGGEGGVGVRTYLSINLQRGDTSGYTLLRFVLGFLIIRA
jgi:hypothetical protein